MVLAVLSLFVTVFSGVVVLALWFEPDRPRRNGQPVALGFAHGGAAAAATAVWIAFAIGRARWVGAASLALLAAAALAGLATVLTTHRRARSHDAAGPAVGVPVALLLAHGLLAVVAVASAVAAFAAT